MRSYTPGQTIAAIATAPGEGGVAIIRISGNEALSIAAQVYSGPLQSYESHKMHFGKIIDKDRKIIDEVLLVCMRAPRSYTGEETVEIHCHGGKLIAKQILELLIESGARAALPGEFTFKAFMNGKMDLAQAEAVQTLIAAKNTLACLSASQQLQGTLSTTIRKFQEELIEIAAILEAWVDFPEEGIEFAPLTDVILSLKTTQNKMAALSATFEEGKLVHEGIALCLCGSPNVGKSSLMNLLLGKDRAIVTEIAGTTRDLIEEDLRIGDLHFRLIDTAGIRETEEMIEKEGIRRSRDVMQSADVILLVLDAMQGAKEEDLLLLQEAPAEKTLIIWNKIDLPTSHVAPGGAIPISAKEGRGLDVLKEAIYAKVFNRSSFVGQEAVITLLRHKEALDRAIRFLALVITGLESGASPEFVSADMRSSLQELGAIIGQDVAEEILSAIFSKFCIGK